MRRNGFERVVSIFSSLAAATVAAACSGDGGTSLGGSRAGESGSGLSSMCQAIQRELSVGAAKDGIPSVQLKDSDLVEPGSVWLDFLLPTDRVIGLEVDGEYVAVPLNILWWHEILNLNDHGLVITYCPLTGSSMVFDRAAAGGAEFGTSGLLYKNNLVMYDRVSSDGEYSLWPQMLAGAFCGPSEGRRLKMVAAIEIEWEDWLGLHPDTRVVGSQTGSSRDYTVYPYGSYAVESNETTLVDVHPDSLDRRRPFKEPILGIPFLDGQGGIAFPFGALRDASVGDLTVVHTILGDDEEGRGTLDPVVVFWDGAAAAAMAFAPRTATRDLTFEVRNGAFVDMETGTQWSIDGIGVSGPLAGERLQAIADAYVSFWFAFSQFFRDPLLWLP